MNYVTLLLVILGTGTSLYFLLPYYIPFGREGGGYIETFNVAILRYLHRKFVIESFLCTLLGVGLAWYTTIPPLLLLPALAIIAIILCLRGIPFRSGTELVPTQTNPDRFIRRAKKSNASLDRLRRGCDTAIVLVVTFSFAINEGGKFIYATAAIVTIVWGLVRKYLDKPDTKLLHAAMLYGIAALFILTITGLRIEIIIGMMIAAVMYKIFDLYHLKIYEAEAEMYNKVRAFFPWWAEATPDEVEAAQEPQRQFSLLRSHRQLREMIAAAKAYSKQKSK